MENTEERNVYERKYYIFFVYKPFFGNYTVYTALMDRLVGNLKISTFHQSGKVGNF